MTTLSRYRRYGERCRTFFALNGAAMLPRRPLLCCSDVEIMTKARDVIKSFIVLARVSFGLSQLKIVLPRMEWTWRHLRHTTCWSWLWSTCGGSSRVIFAQDWSEVMRHLFAQGKSPLRSAFLVNFGDSGNERIFESADRVGKGFFLNNYSH